MSNTQMIAETVAPHLNGNGALYTPPVNGYSPGAAPQPPSAAPAFMPSMLDKCVLLQIDFKRLGNSKSVNSEVVNADTDKSQVSVSKTLLDSPELRNVGKVDEQIKTYLRDQCLPSIIRKGVYLLPLLSVQKVYGKLDSFEATREERIETFIEAYPTLVAQAETRLRALFKADDYPATRVGTDGKLEVLPGYADTLRAAFTLQYNCVTFGVPDILAEIDGQVFEESKNKMNAQWSEAQDMVQQLLRVRVQETVANIQKKLQPNAEGKVRGFSKLAVEKIESFFNDFDALNITDDAALKKLVEDGKALLQGVDPEAVRKSKDLQQSLGEQFSEIESQLTAMIVDKPKRAMSFNDWATDGQ